HERNCPHSGVSTLGAGGALPHQIQMTLLCRKLNTFVLRGNIYIYFFFMQSSVNICVNKLDSQALLFWSNLICVFFCLFACSVKCCSPLSLPFRWGNGPRCPT